MLNSTVVALSKHQFGRAPSVEGNLVVDVNMMLVPDVRKAPPEAASWKPSRFVTVRVRSGCQTRKYVKMPSAASPGIAGTCKIASLKFAQKRKSDQRRQRAVVYALVRKALQWRRP